MTHILKRKPFNVKEFLGEGWGIIEQTKRRSETLDATKIITKDYLKEDESYTNGEERLKRIKATSDDIQLDAEDFLALYEEKGQLTLRWLYKTKGIILFSFWGTILRRPGGGRRVLYLCRGGDGSWRWSFSWVDDGLWRASYPSGVLVGPKHLDTKSLSLEPLNLDSEEITIVGIRYKLTKI